MTEKEDEDERYRMYEDFYEAVVSSIAGPVSCTRVAAIMSVVVVAFENEQSVMTMLKGIDKYVQIKCIRPRSTLLLLGNVP
jgi:hypothetical protein